MHTCILKIVIYTLTSYNHVVMLREVKWKGLLHFISVDWLWYFIDLNISVIILCFHLPEDGHMVGRNMSELTVYKTICKILVCILLVLLYTTMWYLLCWQQPSSSPYPDAYRSTPLHPVCLRSILILYRYPRLGLPWGLCPSSFPTKPCVHFPSASYVPRDHPVSSTLI